MRHTLSRTNVEHDVFDDPSLSTHHVWCSDATTILAWEMTARAELPPYRFHPRCFVTSPYGTEKRHHAVACLLANTGVKPTWLYTDLYILHK